MSFKSSALAFGLKMALKSNNVDNAVAQTAEAIDQLADRHLDTKSDAFKVDLVKQFLLPLCRELTCQSKEAKRGYREALAQEFTALDQSLR